MPDLPLAPTVTSLTVRPWPDPVIDQLGHDPRSAYVERYWLGVLGPTATWLLRRIAERLDEHPDGFELDLAATAAELGVGARGGKHAPFLRSLQRCARFGALELLGDDALRVRRKLPPLTRFQLARLPAHLQADHEGARAPATARPTVDELRERARGVALSLAADGAELREIERGLHEHGVHPALAHAAARWAVEHPMHRVAPEPPLPPAA